jgi:hypothetical protein
LCGFENGEAEWLVPGRRYENRGALHMGEQGTSRHLSEPAEVFGVLRTVRSHVAGDEHRPVKGRRRTHDGGHILCLIPKAPGGQDDGSFGSCGPTWFNTIVDDVCRPGRVVEAAHRFRECGRGCGPGSRGGQTGVNVPDIAIPLRLVWLATAAGKRPGANVRMGDTQNRR